MRIVVHSVLAAALLSSVALAQKTYVAPTTDNITLDRELRQGMGSSAAQAIFVTNGSTVPVTVTGILLVDCENVRWQCGAKQLNVKIRPGQRREIARVEQDKPQRNWNYRIHYTWRADSTDDAARAALGIVKELSRDDLRRVGPQIASLRADPDSIVLEPGMEAPLTAVHLLVRDSAGKVLGQTHFVRFSFEPPRVVTMGTNGRLVARKLGRTNLRYALNEEAQQIVGHPIDELVVPLIVAYPFNPHAPSFTGQAVDADSKKPLACTPVALIDSAQTEVATDRTSANGMFTLTAPMAGTYRVRVDLAGWMPVFSDPQAAAADEQKQQLYAVRFTDQTLQVRNPFEETTFTHATPASLSTIPVSSRTSTKTPPPPIVTLGGSASMPILGVIVRGITPATIWTQFVVDSMGRVDTTSIDVPVGTTATQRKNIGLVLPRVHFSPARNQVAAICELVRMQVNFTQP